MFCLFLYLVEGEEKWLFTVSYTEAGTFPSCFLLHLQQQHVAVPDATRFWGAAFTYFTKVQSCNMPWYIIHQKG